MKNRHKKTNQITKNEVKMNRKTKKMSIKTTQQTKTDVKINRKMQKRKKTK